MGITKYYLARKAGVGIGTVSRSTDIDPSSFAETSERYLVEQQCGIKLIEFPDNACSCKSTIFLPVMPSTINNPRIQRSYQRIKRFGAGVNNSTCRGAISIQSECSARNLRDRLRLQWLIKYGDKPA